MAVTASACKNGSVGSVQGCMWKYIIPNSHLRGLPPSPTVLSSFSACIFKIFQVLIIISSPSLSPQSSPHLYLSHLPSLISHLLSLPCLHLPSCSMLAGGCGQRWARVGVRRQRRVTRIHRRGPRRWQEPRVGRQRLGGGDNRIPSLSTPLLHGFFRRLLFERDLPPGGTTTGSAAGQPRDGEGWIR